MIAQLQMAVTYSRTAGFMIKMVADQLDVFAGFG